MEEKIEQVGSTTIIRYEATDPIRVVIVMGGILVDGPFIVDRPDLDQFKVPTGAELVVLEGPTCTVIGAKRIGLTSHFEQPELTK